MTIHLTLTKPELRASEQKKADVDIDVDPLALQALPPMTNHVTGEDGPFGKTGQRDAKGMNKLLSKMKTGFGL